MSFTTAGERQANLPWGRMAPPRRFTQAAGSMMAISIVAGAVAGVIVGEPSIGVLAGTAAGAGLALLFWLIERRRP